jgi:hypothetical protein
MNHLRRLLGLFLVLSFLAGCGTKIPHQIVPEYEKRALRLIAVLPVENESGDPAAAAMLRDKLVEELYFKGYPKVPLKMVDDALAAFSAAGSGPLTPQAFGRFLQVDAVLYATLKKGQMGSGILFSRTLAEAEFELRSVRSGESLWQTRYGTSYSHFGFFRKSVELKASRVYEAAILEVVMKALSTLPDAGEAPVAK